MNAVRHHFTRYSYAACLALLAALIAFAVACLPLASLAVGIGGIALLAGILLEPLIGIGVALAVGPLRAWLEIVMPGWVPHIGQAVLLLTLGSWLGRKVLARDSEVAFPPLVGSLLGFLVFGLLSLWQPVDIWDGILEFLKWSQVLVIAVVVYARFRRDVRYVPMMLGLLALSAIAQAAVGLWQFGLQEEGVSAFAINDRFYRAYGTFQQPNPYAGMLGLVGSLLLGTAVGLILHRWRDRDRAGAVRVGLMLVVPVGLVLAGLLASWSRGGWMGFGAAMVVLVALTPRRPAWALTLLLAAAMVVGGLALAGRLPAAVMNRLTSFTAYTRFEDVRGVGITDANFSVIERMAHWQAALSMWRYRFWRGVGLGCYEAAYPRHALINWPLPLGHAHNFYLNLLAEVGLPGLLSFVVWLGAMGGGVVWASQQARGWHRGVAIGLAATWTHLATHSVVDNLLVNNVHMHVGVFVALSAWVVSVARTESRESIP